MIAWPAIDLRGGSVVQWVGSRPEEERLSLPDPPAVARRWLDAGFRALHVVDLDAALGRGSNADAIRDILAEAEDRALVQVGGGLREDDAVDACLEVGADRAVVGTRAVEDPAWLADLARRHPDRVVVAADMRDGRVLSRGWTHEAGLAVDELLATLDDMPLAAVLVTDVGREGRMLGSDTRRFRHLAAATRHPLLASGGIAALDDLFALDRAGVAGAVMGMALYTGAIDAAAAAARFSDTPSTEAGS